MSISERVGRTFNSLAVYNYRLFSASQLISLSGTWMQTTAQGWLVLKITNSAVALGTVVALQYFPVALFTLFGGALADRLPKRTVLVGTQSLAAVQALVLAILVLTHSVQLWQIYVLALLLGTINAFDSPTRQAFVSELVGPDRLQNAIALNSSLFNTARIVGPALAGIVISVIGIGQTFLFNALSFIPVIAALLLLHRGELYTSVRAARDNIFRQVGEGVRYAVRTPNILIVLLALAFIGTLGYNYPIFLPLLAKFVLHAGATGLGVLTSAVGVGRADGSHRHGLRPPGISAAGAGSRVPVLDLAYGGRCLALSAGYPASVSGDGGCRHHLYLQLEYPPAKPYAGTTTGPRGESLSPARRRNHPDWRVSGGCTLGVVWSTANHRADGGWLSGGDHCRDRLRQERPACPQRRGRWRYSLQWMS